MNCRSKLGRLKVIKQSKWKLHISKSFTALLSTNQNPISHMEWSNDSFKKMPPKPLPYIHIKAETMPEIAASLSTMPKLLKRPHAKILAFADSGCQTCTAGTELLRILRYPKEALIPTTHKISGITAQIQKNRNHWSAASQIFCKRTHLTPTSLHNQQHTRHIPFPVDPHRSRHPHY